MSEEFIFTVHVGARLKVRAKDKADAIAKTESFGKVLINLIPLSSKAVISKEPFWRLGQIEGGKEWRKLFRQGALGNQEAYNKARDTRELIENKAKAELQKLLKEKPMQQEFTFYERRINRNEDSET